jgi:hypothetical protein
MDKSLLKRIIQSSAYDELKEEIEKRVNIEILQPFTNDEPLKIYGEVRYREGLRAIITILNNIEEEINV